MSELASSRFSVLIGAAGTGKTTLLKFLCKAAPIQQRGVLLLAPTGKARVRLQQATGFEARTIAQFLRPARYKEATQTYRVIGDVERVSTYKTVIVDDPRCSQRISSRPSSMRSAASTGSFLSATRANCRRSGRDGRSSSRLQPIYGRELRQGPRLRASARTDAGSPWRRWGKGRGLFVVHRNRCRPCAWP